MSLSATSSIGYGYRHASELRIPHFRAPPLDAAVEGFFDAIAGFGDVAATQQCVFH